MSVFLAFCFFGSVLGGELYSYHFEEPSDDVEHVYAPTAMALLSNIDKGVVFGRVDIHHNWAYVTTLGDDNKAESNYHTLKEVRVINAAVAHPSPAKGGVVLVAGMARSDSKDFDNDLPFVGALQVLQAAGGGMEYSWLMFEVTGELFMKQQMHAIEVFPTDDLNLFVAVGNLVADAPVTSRGLILAAFSLDDFSPLYTLNYKPVGSFQDSGIPKAVERLSTDQLLVAVGSHYLVRFRVSQIAMSVHWCVNIESAPFPDRDIVGVHVLAQKGVETILVTGNKIIEDRSHPFVKEFDLNGWALRNSFWDYTDTDNDMDQVYTSFLDTDEGMLYLGGSHDEYELTTALVLVWDTDDGKLEEAGFWRGGSSGQQRNPIIAFEYMPKSVRAIAKAESGTMLFAIEAMTEFEPEAGLLTMTGIDCLLSVLKNMDQYSDESNTTSVDTEYLKTVVYSNVSANENECEIDERELTQAMVWCTDATKTPTTLGPDTTSKIIINPTIATKETTTTSEAGGSGGNGTTSDGFVVLAVALVIIGILCGIAIGYYVSHGKDGEHRSNAVDEDVNLGDVPTVEVTTSKKRKPGKYVRVEEETEEH